MHSITLFGTPTITADGAPVNITRRKSRAILYYLAAHHRPLTRDQLLVFFWPDLERPAAQQILRTTLHGLRKSLGDNVVIKEDTLTLSPDVDIDVRRFETGLQTARQTSNLLALIATLQLYNGDFLEGFSLPDTPEFDDWAAVERERLRRLAVRGFSSLGQRYEAEGHYAPALEALERALAFDPLQEDLQRAAMRLHYLAGDRAAAIRRYDSLRKLLDEEMGVPPMAETRRLYDDIINDRIAVPEIKADVPVVTDAEPQAPNALAQPVPPLYQLPFTGRQAELAALESLTTSHKLGLLEGEPGIGKTRLSEQFINSSNVIVLAGSAHELEDAIPYQPIIEALRSLLTRTDWPVLHAALQEALLPVWLGEVARLVPELDANAHASALSLETVSQGAAARADESRLWEGLHQFLITLAAQHAVLLFIDDLQWADSSCLAVLGYLVRQPPAAVVYLAATRPPEPRSALAALLQTLTREDRLMRIPLGRFAKDDIAFITKNLCGESGGRFTEWLAASSEGNPYVLAELMRYARDNNLLLADGSVNMEVLSNSPVVPHTIYTLTQARLAGLSDPARRVLDAAVAAGREFEFDVVYRAAGLSELAALDAVDELLGKGLVRPVDWLASSDMHAGRIFYTFDHSVTMEVAYRDVGEARHRLAHRRVAEAIENVYGRTRLDPVSGVIASHYMEGGDAGRAAPYAIRAAKQATRLAAWNEVAHFLDIALESDGLEDTQRYDVYMELGEARGHLGQADSSAEAFKAALDLAPDNSHDAQLARLLLARSYILQARFAKVIEVAKQVKPLTPSLAARAEFIWGTALSIEGADLESADEHLRKGEGLLRDMASPADLPWLAQIKFEQGSVAAQQGDLNRAIGLYREALEIAEEAPGDLAVAHRVLANNNLGYHLHLAGDPSAEQYVSAGLKIAQEAGILPLQTFLFSTLGEIALAAGKLDEAEKVFNDGLALAERLGMPERIAGLTANLGLVARARSQTDLAIHRLSSALSRADSLGVRHLASQIRIWLAPLLPPAEAHNLLAEARAIAQDSGRKKLLDDIARVEGEMAERK